MKCPGCRVEIPFDAVEHGKCGWKISSRAVAVPVIEPPVERLAHAKVREHVERMREILRRPKTEVKPEVPVTGRAQVPMTTDEGHGIRCECECCWAVRMQRIFPGLNFLTGRPQVKEALERAKLQASPVADKPEPVEKSVERVDNSRLARLREMFPVEG